MKIGILTHHYINNYGAFLQGYALMKYLKEACPEDTVEIIDYWNNKHAIINVGGFFRFKPSTENITGYLQKIRQPLMYRKVRREKYSLSKKVTSAKEIEALSYDLIIVGSDEVWNYEDEKSFDLVKFGYGIATERTDVIAYAPSVGRVHDFDPVPKLIEIGLSTNFSAVSARDENTRKLLEASTKKTPVMVLDPTFLTSLPKRYSAKVEKLTKDPYVLFYYCDGMPATEYKRIRDEAHAKGLRVLGAGQNCKYFDADTADVDVFEWTALFAGAEEVYTGTFHGTVFSILNRKKFHHFISIESRKQKIAQLLEEFGISDGLDIDYDAVYENIVVLREQSKNYLLENIESIRNKKRGC